MTDPESETHKLKNRTGKYAITACLLILAMLGTIGVQAVAATKEYKDVDVKTAEGQAIQKMTSSGVLDGYPDGTFRPTQSLTRSEFVKVANLVFGFTRQEKPYKEFSDVDSTNWARENIIIAQQAGYIHGVGGNRFNPTGLVTREEVCIMIGRIQQFKDLLQIPVNIKDTVSPWAAEAVKTAINCGLFPNPVDGKFRATEPITRGELCVAMASYVTVPNPTPTPTPPGGSSNSGGSETPSNPETTPDPVTEEAQVAGYMANMLAKYKEKPPTSPAVKENLDLLMDCMQRALDARKNSGVVLSREYIEATFGTEIEAFKQGYKAMTKDDIALANGFILNLADSSQLNAVMKYFNVNIQI